MAAQNLVNLGSEKTETPAGSKPEERECLHLKGCRLRNAYKHKQERGVLTIAAQSLVSLSAEKTETPAGSRPKTAEKRCETAGTKKAETLPTEPSKDKKRPQ